jgi:3-deoxy-D-manno-octulosonic-acid transferase
MPRPDGRLLWLHAASVGESQSALPVLDHLVRGSGLTVLLTTGTVTSATLLASQMGRFGPGRVLHRFVPLDVPAWAARFLDHWRPDAAAFVESELWPNLLAACRHRRIPLMLVNARMSERSMRGWARVPAFARAVLRSFDLVHPQSAADGERLLALGARSLEPAGNLKLAAPPLPADPAALAGLKRVIGARPVWLAASTHPGEEDVAVEVHRVLAPAHPGLLTIVAPRHPDRGIALAQAYNAPRRSAGEGPEAGGVWIADTMGELGLLYRLSPAVFVGKSLAGQSGGQNLLEPARLGCAIATGPATTNFADAAERLAVAGGLTIVADGAALTAWVDTMLRDQHACRQAGEAARLAASGEEALPARIAAALLELVARA